MFEAHALAIIFVTLMGVAVLAYAVLDGFDLGVGIITALARG
jgi:cytochrome d ubiquinol oxidase subunit II